MLVSGSNWWAWPEFHTPGPIHLWRWRGVRGSHSPGAPMLPCPKHPGCHHAIRSDTGQQGGKCQIYKGNSTKNWCLIHSHAWHHDLFYALSYWMTLYCQCVMRCHVMSVTLSSVSRQSPCVQPGGQGGRIHSNVARYLDKPGLNMIPACCAPHGQPPLLGTLAGDGDSQLFQNAIDPRPWCVKLNDYFGRARVPVPGRGGHMSLIIVIKTTVSDPGINLSQAKTSLFNELHSQGKNRGKTWLINHKLA